MRAARVTLVVLVSAWVMVAGEPSRREVPPSRARQPSRPTNQAPAMDLPPPRSGRLVLRSPAVADGGALPVAFTGDGNRSTLPLEWSGAPDGTRAFCVVMHHVDPEGRVKCYWTLYNIPAEVRGLPENGQGVGILGNNSINRRPAYAPPHSKGPGPKVYILTAYALSAPVQIPPGTPEVNREVLLAAMQGLILDSAELKVVYTRQERSVP